MKGTWQTTGSGGAPGELAVIIVAVAAAVAVPVINAITNLLVVLAVIVAALIVLGSAGLVLLLLYQARRRHALTGTLVSPARAVPWRPAEAPRTTAPRAIEGPRELHLHLGGVDAATVVEILKGVNQDRGPS